MCSMTTNFLKEILTREGHWILENDNKNFSLTFSKFPLIVTGTLFNKYKLIGLVGFHNQWDHCRYKTNVPFNIPIFFLGIIIFEVKAMNSHGVWSPISTYK